jgi:hypothetical protein
LKTQTRVDIVAQVRHLAEDTGRASDGPLETFLDASARCGRYFDKEQSEALHALLWSMAQILSKHDAPKGL